MTCDQLICNMARNYNDTKSEDDTFILQKLGFEVTGIKQIRAKTPLSRGCNNRNSPLRCDSSALLQVTKYLSLISLSNIAIPDESYRVRWPDAMLQLPEF
jgi:hypothetical protein